MGHYLKAEYSKIHAKKADFYGSWKCLRCDSFQWDSSSVCVIIITVSYSATHLSIQETLADYKNIFLSGKWYDYVPLKFVLLSYTGHNFVNQNNVCKSEKAYRKLKFDLIDSICHIPAFSVHSVLFNQNKQQQQKKPNKCLPCTILN